MATPLSSRDAEVDQPVCSMINPRDKTMPAWESAKSEVEDATRAWVAAFDNRDAEKIAALYHPDAILLGTTSPTIISTPAGVRQYFDQVCTANMQLKVVLGQHFVRVIGDTAINSGHYHLSFVAECERRSLEARYSFTYQKLEGIWLIVDHHSSTVPAENQAKQ